MRRSHMCWAAARPRCADTPLGRSLPCGSTRPHRDLDDSSERRQGHVHPEPPHDRVADPAIRRRPESRARLTKAVRRRAGSRCSARGPRPRRRAAARLRVVAAAACMLAVAAAVVELSTHTATTPRPHGHTSGASAGDPDRRRSTPRREWCSSLGRRSAGMAPSPATPCRGWAHVASARHNGALPVRLHDFGRAPAVRAGRAVHGAASGLQRARSGVRGQRRRDQPHHHGGLLHANVDVAADAPRRDRLARRRPCAAASRGRPGSVAGVGARDHRRPPGARARVETVPGDGRLAGGQSGPQR